MKICAHRGKERCTPCQELFRRPVQEFVWESYLGTKSLERYWYLKAINETHEADAENLHLEEDREEGLLD